MDHGLGWHKHEVDVFLMRTIRGVPISVITSWTMVIALIIAAIYLGTIFVIQIFQHRTINVGQLALLLLLASISKNKISDLCRDRRQE